jgi:sucrose synthase
MMVNDKIQSLGALRSSLRKAEDYLLSVPQDTPYSEFNIR